MAKFGDYVAYDGLIYRIVAVSEDAEPTYTLEPVRKSETELKKTVDVSQSQLFLIPSGGSNLASIAGSAITQVGSRTAVANALADGYVRVKFDVDGGTEIASQVIEDGALATDVADPTKEHYTFDNWYYDDGTFASVVNFTTDVFDDDTTIYAKWIIDTFTVTYDSNGGSTVSAETVDYGSLATEPADPTLLDNTFDGWYTDNSTFLEAYDFATPVTANITLYAKWI